MSRQRKKKEVTPISSAGLITYYEEDISNVKVSPGLAVFLSILLTSIVILLNVGIIRI
ncbi:MAG TPA: preprotein translocase subunit Sec61beta [Geobacterales bacterium]|jgi:preprotein translocase subunit Sec61beta|nr:preprotein translocase subunit Sec61beta [Geobacterales bacterium]